VHPEDFVDSLQLNDELVLNQDIDSASAIELQPLVFDRQGPLELEREAGKLQLARQTLFIGRLQQARTELSVNLECAADHST
jgi:hypothetical protein